MSHLHTIDYAVLALFFLSTLYIGWRAMRKAGKDSSEFFLSGRSTPWWLLGFSLVATTFAADTPNFVTNVVRTEGVAGNWVWWAFLPTGMTTVFIYARLWRKLGVMTDIEFYETRYSGKSGAFVRGFRTMYLGLCVNTLIMANVTLAIIKIFGVMLGFTQMQTLLISGTVTVLFTMIGGFSAVLWADFVLFIIAMAGSIAAAVVAVNLPEVGGLHALVSNEAVASKLSFIPNLYDPKAVVTLLFVPLAVQWWSAWYPGAEPGGGSYTAQRMLAAKTPGHAVGATLFFNFCHYAVRPWPWILVALASIIVFPNLESLAAAFPNVPVDKVKDDIAYPAMMTLLPPGIFGIVVASLFAAYMSTIATHLNLGSSYMVNDFYKRFINKDAPEKKLVMWGRVWTVIFMILSCYVAVFLESALDAFQIILSIGAGTGLLFLLRWFWWRLNAYSEIAAMCLALPIACFFKFYKFPEGSLLANASIQLVASVAITTVGWLIVTFLTPPDDKETLREFVRKTRAGGPGWKKVYDDAAKEGVELIGAKDHWNVPLGILCSVIGCVAIYAALFCVGAFLYGEIVLGSILLTIAVVGSFMLFLCWREMRFVVAVNGETD